MNYYKLFRQNTKALRVALEYSQKELGLKIGVSDKTISAYECGFTVPPLDRMQMLADALYVAMYDLAYNEVTQSIIDRALLAKRLAGVQNVLNNLPFDKIE